MRRTLPALARAPLLAAALALSAVAPLRAEPDPAVPEDRSGVEALAAADLAAAVDALREAARSGAAEAIAEARQALERTERDLADLQARIESGEGDGEDLDELRLQLEVLQAQAALALHQLSRQAQDTLGEASRTAAEALSKLDAWLREQRRDPPPPSPWPSETLDI